MMLLLVFLLLSWRCMGVSSSAYFADWSALANDRQPTCVPIPRNMSLCANIGYRKMRLPNLLEHDTIHEASQQASSWVPLMNVKCAEDSQLFLCSLFAPVCLERPIYPCRSLCQKVKLGCEGTMKTYGFPWPSMLDCDKFPLDNDMCITSQAEAKQEEEGESTSCKAKPCNQANTYENILANYCQADFVIKMKFKDVRRRSIWGRKVNTVYKTWRGTPSELRKLRKPKMKLSSEDQCCSDWIKAQPKKQRFLVMGKKISEKLVPTLILPWTRNKEMKRARRKFKQIDCSNLRETSQRMIAEAFAPHTMFSQDSNVDSRRRRRTQTGRKRRHRQQEQEQQHKRRHTRGGEGHHHLN